MKIRQNVVSVANGQLASAQLARAQLANPQLANVQLANVQLASVQLANPQCLNSVAKLLTCCNICNVNIDTSTKNPRTFLANT
jgi:hypothetical protein